MTFDIAELVETRGAEKFALYEQYVYPWSVYTARKLGFDKHFTSAEGPYLFDNDSHRYLDMDGGLGVFCHGRNNPQQSETILNPHSPSNLLILLS